LGKPEGHSATFVEHRRPGPVVVLDDDSAFLEMLGMTLPSELDVRLYTDPDLCVDSLLRQIPSVQADAWAHREILEKSRRGTSLIQLMTSYWARHTERMGLAQVLVLDYNMPRASGTHYLGGLQGWQGRRILLTGLDDMEAVEPFVEAGHIESVIHKKMQGMSRHLVSELRSLLASAPTEVSRIWRDALTSSQRGALAAPGVSRELHELVQARCVEFVILPKPFGVLGLDAEGDVHWLQLAEPSATGEMATEAIRRGLPAALVHEVHSGTCLLDADLLEAVASDRAVSAYPAFSLGAGRRLLGAWLPLPDGIVKPLGYLEWLAANRNRSVIES